MTQPATTEPTWAAGIQTIIWGREIEDLPYAMDVMAAAGFTGIEIAQRPDTLPPYSELQKMLEDRGLRLLGLAGGSILERMEYLAGDRSPYLYVDTWNDDQCRKAMKDDHVLSLHPHMYKQFQRLETAKKWLYDYPNTRWLPDTAHLWIAGEPIDEWFPKKYLDRTDAIHFKDWTSVYGRWSHRYARGFTALGDGMVPVKNVLEKLHSISWSAKQRYLIAEQDTPGHYSAEDAIYRAAEWFAVHAGIKIEPKRERPTTKGRSKAVEETRTVADTRTLSLLEIFEELLGTSTVSSIEFYTKAAAAIRRLSSGCLVAIWAYSPAYDLISLLGADSVEPSDIDVLLEDSQAPLGKLLSRIAVDRNAPTKFNLAEADPGAEHRYSGLQSYFPKLKGTRNCAVCYCLPIPNSYNSHHTRLLIHVLLEKQTEEIERLYRDCCDISRVFDAWLSERCVTAAGEVNARATECRTVNEYCQMFVELLQKSLPCEAATIFRNVPPGVLRDVASTGLVWKTTDNRKEQYYARGEGYTGLTFRDRTPLLTRRSFQIPGRKGKSEEVVKDPSKDECLVAPMIAPDGTIWGVLRCRNKLQAETTFSDDDLAITNAMLDAAMPTLVSLGKVERDRQAQDQTVHELNKPLAAVRGAIDLMQTELQGKPSPFTYDYLEDALSWTELMAKILEAKDYLNEKEITLLKTPTLLLKDVIAPAKRQARIAIREKGFEPSAITDNGFFLVPRLDVDRNLMQQVVFNMLENAVKYCDAKAKFSVQIVGGLRWDDDKQYYAVIFRDSGIGVDEKWKEAIFEKGVRGEDAAMLNVQGHGLGLWIVRRLVEAHGGKVKLTNFRNPTEFTILLPKSLASDPTPMGL